MKKRSNLIYFQIILILAAIILSAYATYATASAYAYSEPAVAAKEPDISTNLETSNEVNNYIKTIKGVSNSVCFIIFDQCYVAFKCEDLVTKESINAVKIEIENLVPKKFDKIKTVFATNDINTFVKMENVIKRLNAGEKVTEMKSEIIELKKLFHGNKRFRHIKKKK